MLYFLPEKRCHSSRPLGQGQFAFMREDLGTYLMPSVLDLIRADGVPGCQKFQALFFLFIDYLLVSLYGCSFLRAIFVLFFSLTLMRESFNTGCAAGSKTYCLIICWDYMEVTKPPTCCIDKISG